MQMVSKENHNYHQQKFKKEDTKLAAEFALGESKSSLSPCIIMKQWRTQGGPPATSRTGKLVVEKRCYFARLYF